MKIIQLLGSKYRTNSVLSRWRSGSWVATWYQAMQDLSGKSSKSSLEIPSGDKETSSPAKNWQQQIRDPSWSILKLTLQTFMETFQPCHGSKYRIRLQRIPADAPLPPSLQGLLHEVAPTWQHIPPPPPVFGHFFQLQNLWFLVGEVSFWWLLIFIRISNWEVLGFGNKRIHQVWLLRFGGTHADPSKMERHDHDLQPESIHPSARVQSPTQHHCTLGSVDVSSFFSTANCCCTKLAYFPPLFLSKTVDA